MSTRTGGGHDSTVLGQGTKTKIREEPMFETETFGNIPLEVLEAEGVLSAWMRENGHFTWKLGNCQNRTYNE